MAFKHITAQDLEEMCRADAELDDEIAAQQRAYYEAHKDEIAAQHGLSTVSRTEMLGS